MPVYYIKFQTFRYYRPKFVKYILTAFVTDKRFDNNDDNIGMETGRETVCVLYQDMNVDEIDFTFHWIFM